MNEQEQAIQTLKAKAEFFFDNHVEVHIPKKNHLFSRGFIEDIGDDKILLDERKEGKNTPVYFTEMVDILKCIEEVKDGK